MLRTADLEYDLPPERVAVRPAEPRDSARLLVLSRSDPDRLDHLSVRDLPSLLHPGDMLVVNRSRVLPARFAGVREDTGGRVDGLYLHDGPTPGTWVCLLRARRFREGARVRVEQMAKEPKGQRAKEEEQGGKSESGVVLVLLERAPEPAGAWVVRVEQMAKEPNGQRAEEDDAGERGLRAPEVLERIGVAPLPPYILAARRAAGLATDAPEDREWYQTVYAEREQMAGGPRGERTGENPSAAAGSVAAPTAGLHFTDALLREVEERGVRVAGVTLHVGAGTFRAVETEFVEQHPMHAEWCSMTPEAVAMVQRTRREGGRVIAVGTTAGRTLETYAAERERTGATPPAVETRLLITPGYPWRWVDGLMTNFHLPRSTLMAMVAARLGESGVDRLKRAYVQAINSGYRFYSYGDAMIVLP
ncbi:MAG: S-adenosylmethionine:tRNA ribosyltransferase-isomerase [Leptolyngbya sp. PLA2]|nr:S-adenosylmethionine:tRNA ribosyltransferase-isomerase [Leptolyngbya sp.]MCE7971973.1 S-adenosylmethionine:tRNA ribosyltransferase-isomerase [Leptolyngbya sp. PL-A2]MCQ3940907.1 S-adenosylmethionine:tRNA ribosyltransferase-isomerase [cyanobacterium CYA1]MCZ7634056.1 S-adenosylmethionine:tRNA ribosyltransferase-isomerase [Phycisphaerales bacterium]MDL1905220.1 S-adenosylmethionine:tRNA ribosyltransferase-isomerase [Synechococcales cyanobacterium CNB]GIK19227.1 MAG: S-adenosylmethionine:tRNA 